MYDPIQNKRFRTTGRAARSMIFIALLVMSGCTRDENRDPHLVLISIDTLRADILDTVSREQGEDGFAAIRDRFIRCDKAISTASWTLPAHASMLTGLLPSDHGAVKSGSLITDDATPIAEVLNELGYETIAFTDGGYVDARFGFGRGFDLFNTAGKNPHHVEAARALPRRGAPESIPGVDPFDRAKAFIANRESTAPLFLFLHTFGVHDYYRARPWIKRAPETNALANRASACMLEPALCSESDWATLTDWYAQEVRRMGSLMKSLVEDLERDLEDRPVMILLTSDHGEGFDPSGGRVHHAGLLHPEFLRVPFWLGEVGGDSREESEHTADAGSPCGSRLVSLVDVAPTLASLAGGDPSSWTGTPIALRENADAISETRAVAHAEEHGFFWRDGRRHEAAAHDPDVPKIALIEDSLWVGVGGGEEWILRWQEDRPHATGDAQSTEFVRILADARSRLESAQPTDSREMTLDEDLRSRLEALGYVGEL